MLTQKTDQDIIFKKKKEEKKKGKIERNKEKEK